MNNIYVFLNRNFGADVWDTQKKTISDLKSRLYFGTLLKMPTVN